MRPPCGFLRPGPRHHRSGLDSQKLPRLLPEQDDGRPCRGNGVLRPRRALADNAHPDSAQVLTWNDYTLGTQFEPSWPKKARDCVDIYGQPCLTRRNRYQYETLNDCTKAVGSPPDHSLAADGSSRSSSRTIHGQPHLPENRHRDAGQLLTTAKLRLPLLISWAGGGSCGTGNSHRRRAAPGRPTAPP